MSKTIDKFRHTEEIVREHSESPISKGKKSKKSSTSHNVPIIPKSTNKVTRSKINSPKRSI